MFSVRIVNIDYYMSYPLQDLDIVYSEFRGIEVRQVPVIQIYGSTQTAKKTSVHVHGVLPYIYIPYDGLEPAGSLSYKIASELDKALNISLGQASASTCHVHNVQLVSGIPMYGYHERQHQFFKIYFYNPAIVKKACSLLENGVVLGKCFQPHEAHINYILQFMIDYNLHGMSFMHVSVVRPRGGGGGGEPRRRTVCEVEVDALAADITNAAAVPSGQLAANPGLAALWEDERQRRRDKHLDSSHISFSLTQERPGTTATTTATHRCFEDKLQERLARKQHSSNEDSTLDKSVYPAETPDHYDILSASAAQCTVLDASLFDDTLVEEQQECRLNESDVNLLEMLKEMKENAHVEEDSILSQRAPEKESEGSSDEEVHNLSVALAPADEATSTDSAWEDSFWDGACKIPQVDGACDSSDSSPGGELTWVARSNVRETRGEFRLDGAADEAWRRADEVYIEARRPRSLPSSLVLAPGRNVLLTSQPRAHTVPAPSRVTILNDVRVKCDVDSQLLWKVDSGGQVRVSVHSKVSIADRDLASICNGEQKFVDDFEEHLAMDDVLYNDVNLGIMTPMSSYSFIDKSLSPEGPAARHFNDSFLRQTPRTSPLYDYMFSDSLGDSIEENFPDTFLTTPKTTKNKSKKNARCKRIRNRHSAPELRPAQVPKQTRYNLRSSVSKNTLAKEEKSCKWCVEGHLTSPDSSTACSLNLNDLKNSLKNALNSTLGTNVAHSKKKLNKQDKTIKAERKQKQVPSACEKEIIPQVTNMNDNNKCIKNEAQELGEKTESIRISSVIQTKETVQENIYKIRDTATTPVLVKKTRKKKIKCKSLEFKENICQVARTKSFVETASVLIQSNAKVAGKTDKINNNITKSNKRSNKATDKNNSVLSAVVDVSCQTKCTNKITKATGETIKMTRAESVRAMKATSAGVDRVAVKRAQMLSLSLDGQGDSPTSGSSSAAEDNSTKQKKSPKPRGRKPKFRIVSKKQQTSETVRVNDLVQKKQTQQSSVVITTPFAQQSATQFEGRVTRYRAKKNTSPSTLAIQAADPKLCAQAQVILMPLQPLQAIKNGMLTEQNQLNSGVYKQSGKLDNAIKHPLKIYSSSDSDEVLEPTDDAIKINKMNCTPTKRIRNKKSASSPKYSPLNIIVKSPRKKVINMTAELCAQVDYYEPLSKRLRSSDIRANASPNNDKEIRPAGGIGELQAESNRSALRTEDHQREEKETLKDLQIGEPKSCDILNQNIPVPVPSASITVDRNLILSNKYIPENIKRRLLFNNRDTNSLSITLVEEKKVCSYEKATRPVLKQSIYKARNNLNSVYREIENSWRQDEENFLDEIDQMCELNSQQESSERARGSSPPDGVMLNEDYRYDETTVMRQSRLNLAEMLKQNTAGDVNEDYMPESMRTSDVIPFSDADFPSPDKPTGFLLPEKSTTIITLPNKPADTSCTEKTAVYPGFHYNVRETLSQQYENECSDLESNCYTKINNLTVAERYDLERDFAPQPGTSRHSDQVISLPSPSQCNSPDSFVFDISLKSNYNNTVIGEADSSSLQLFSTNNLSGLVTTSSNDEHLSQTLIFMPKYLPPTRADVVNSLAEYNIPEHRFQEPFFSDYSDVTGKVDVGHNVLKIPGKTTADLEEFDSSTGFAGIESWRKEKFNELYPSEDVRKSNLRVALAGNRETILTPSVRPPSRQDVLLWLKSKSSDDVKEKSPKKVAKPRILIPASPGNDNDSCDESMTLSPCTPQVLSSQSTPQSSQDSPSLIRKGKSKRKGTLQRKALFSQSKLKSTQSDDISMKAIELNESHSPNHSCQITGVTLDNTHGFKMSYENLQDARAVNEPQHLTILVVELHIRTRVDLNPDPQYDSVRAIFYSIYNDVPEDAALPREETGVLAVDTLPGSPAKQQARPILDGAGLHCQIVYVKSELELIEEFVKLIRKWDPDIFAGYEIELLSWGYLIERCSVIGINLSLQISRLDPSFAKQKPSDTAEPTREIKLSGRIVLDIWRLFRHEIALQSYTFENLMYHILHRRVPAHSFRSLSFWWEHRSNLYRHITANYYVVRVEGVLKLLDQLDIVGRTSELARLFGIQFYEVLSRGSQFRVESLMLRLAKPLHFVAVSPSVQQRARMRAPEWLPLILEPESRFYADPVIVLDFQSLYPSIIIAYNYCFSTCIGRVEKLGSDAPFEFGATQLKVTRAMLGKLKDRINFSPCGVGFVRAEVRRGVLPRMLQEILETRLMVKNSMKENKGDKLLQRVLHSRQLGLKLIANVTYGYTAANFSGRMPCSEVGDSVVSKGRETLERAIRLIERTQSWGARVVYGDTDSLFVLVAGRSRQDAFRIGAEIAAAVTADNPPPVKLKLEKVYQPCILQTKKRYVGYMYEAPDQPQPQYDAKGIETVRRDGCPAVAKMLEKSLRVLFETRDVSLVKRYVCRQFGKLVSGRASVQELVFAREYRGAAGYRPGACVPALELARRWTALDRRREPRRGQRVPYVVVHGPPGLPLIRLVRCPSDLLADASALRPNALYYITRVIAPPLNRCLALLGADALAWFNEMPRKQLHTLPTHVHAQHSKKSTISQYFATTGCAACGQQTRGGLCARCRRRPQDTAVALLDRLGAWERAHAQVTQICESCCGRGDYTECTSLDCPVLYRLTQVKRDLKQVPFVRNLLTDNFSF